MTYRSLLVLLDTDPLCSVRTQAAIRLAKAFDAHLTGLAPTGLLDLPGSPSAAAWLAEFASLAWDALRQQADDAAQAFRGACKGAGLRHFDAVVEQGDTRSAMLSYAHCHDLTVLTQENPEAPSHTNARQLLEQAILFSARPTLVLPRAGSFDGCCQTVMVSWDDSCEAAAAVADALPLLKQAKTVHVVSWKENGLFEATDRPAPLEGLRRWLQRHGVEIQMHTEITSARIADAMLSRAAELQADLIVMGAYGHARWAQRILGGATSGLLASMTVPVLMSH